MSEQQSKKRGLKSESQKEEKARDAYEPIPPSNPVRGAFGGGKKSDSSAAEPGRTGRERRQPDR